MNINEVTTEVRSGKSIDLTDEVFSAALLTDLFEVKRHLLHPLVESLDVYVKSMEGVNFNTVTEMREFARNISSLLKAFDLKLEIPFGRNKGELAGLGVTFSAGKPVFVFRTNDYKATLATDRCPVLILQRKPPERGRGPAGSG